MSQTSATRPAGAQMTSIMPKAIESKPLSASSHSPLSSLRNAMADTTAITPVKIAQPAMTASNAMTVIPG